MIPGYYCQRCTACCHCGIRSTSSTLDTVISTIGNSYTPSAFTYSVLPKPRRDRPWYRDKEAPRRREWWKR